MKIASLLHLSDKCLFNRTSCDLRVANCPSLWRETGGGIELFRWCICPFDLLYPSSMKANAWKFSSMHYISSRRITMFLSHSQSSWRRSLYVRLLWHHPFLLETRSPSNQCLVTVATQCCSMACFSVVAMLQRQNDTPFGRSHIEKWWERQQMFSFIFLAAIFHTSNRQNVYRNILTLFEWVSTHITVVMMNLIVINILVERK